MTFSLILRAPVKLPNQGGLIGIHSSQSTKPFKDTKDSSKHVDEMSCSVHGKGTKDGRESFVPKQELSIILFSHFLKLAKCYFTTTT